MSYQTNVCCFRTNEKGEFRFGIWAMTKMKRGAFFHGSRCEVQAPLYSIGELSDEFQAITPEQAMKELEGWPEAQAKLKKIFDRHPRRDFVKPVRIDEDR